MPNKNLRAKTPKRTSRGPLLSWIPIPKTNIKHRETTRLAKKEAAPPSLPGAGLLIRMLPVLALAIMVLIVVAPSLPQLMGGAINWVVGLLPSRSSSSAEEPVFIVEAADGQPPNSELPPPNWSLLISPIFTPEVQTWQDRISQWSVSYRIKPNMIATIMQIESCGNPEAMSDMGAIGLFQVMPLHFQAGEGPTDPDTNAGRALLYFGEMLASVNGDPGLAFAAYNGGPSIAFTSPTEWPSETQDYQYWASGIYEEAELGLGTSPTLQAWLESGGYGLCAEAAQVLGLAE